MSANVDNRLLERWQTSCRHQDEARRFLARQRFTNPQGDGRALEEIAGTIADMERILRQRAVRPTPQLDPPEDNPSSTRP